MTTHTSSDTINLKRWRRVKAKLIEKYGTVKAAAVIAGCHPNSLRLASVGRATRVAANLRNQMGIKV